jgi:hypothetical protein
MLCQSSAHGVVSRLGTGWEEQEAAYTLYTIHLKKSSDAGKEFILMKSEQ